MRYTMSLLGLLLSAALWSGCGDNPFNASQTGRLRVGLTDAPAAFKAVNVTFAELSAHLDGSWITVRGNQSATVNLLEWNNGKAMLIGAADVPAGRYTQIRLKVQSAEVVTMDGQTHQVTIPSGDQTGLKLVSEFNVSEGSTSELVLDFDVQKCIVATGSQKFVLRPTIRVAPVALTGSISGTVAGAQHMPVAFAIAGSDTVTSTPVNAESGSFRLAFLSAGNYTVAVADTTGRSYAKSNVAVTVGSDLNIGSISLNIGVGN
ncbi:DUF4382 domain-containing protein [bacterium]|nr:DUF4382 domain-containing protein [bacterium]